MIVWCLAVGYSPWPHIVTDIMHADGDIAPDGSDKAQWIGPQPGAKSPKYLRLKQFRGLEIASIAQDNPPPPSVWSLGPGVDARSSAVDGDMPRQSQEQWVHISLVAWFHSLAPQRWADFAANTQTPSMHSAIIDAITHMLPPSRTSEEFWEALEMPLGVKVPLALQGGAPK